MTTGTTWSADRAAAGSKVRHVASNTLFIPVPEASAPVTRTWTQWLNDSLKLSVNWLQRSAVTPARRPRHACRPRPRHLRAGAHRYLGDNHASGIRVQVDRAPGSGAPRAHSAHSESLAHSLEPECALDSLACRIFFRRTGVHFGG